MKIGEFSSCSGIPVDTLRYYDKIGLLTPGKVKKQRIYSEDDLKKVKAIVKLKRLNFSLEEIREILDIDQKLEEKLKLGVMSHDLVYHLKETLDAKYSQILQLEQGIREVKTELEHIMGKIDQFLKN